MRFKKHTTETGRDRDRKTKKDRDRKTNRSRDRKTETVTDGEDDDDDVDDDYNDPSHTLEKYSSKYLQRQQPPFIQMCSIKIQNIQTKG